MQHYTAIFESPIFKKAFANSTGTQCLFDMQHRLISLINANNKILGVLRFELLDDQFAKIETVATAVERKGYGYQLYLSALAALAPGMQFIPDPFQPSDVCLNMWYRLYEDDAIIKTSLKGTPRYRLDFDASYSHELAGLNPDVICEQWDAWQITDDIYTHLRSGSLNPHPSNVAFTLPEYQRQHVAATITPYVFTPEQIAALNGCLQLDYESLGSPKADTLRRGVTLPSCSVTSALKVCAA
jgi:hypothetical protein